MGVLLHWPEALVTHLPSYPAACASGVWGPQCDKPCHCGNNSSCDPRSGACLCPAGLQPPFCLQPCQPGHYGPACQLSCQCHGLPCDPQTGACLCPQGRNRTRCVKGVTSLCTKECQFPGAQEETLEF